MRPVGVAPDAVWHQPHMNGEDLNQFDLQWSHGTQQWDVPSWNYHVPQDALLSEYHDEAPYLALMTQDSNVEVLSLFAECVGASVSSDSTDFPEKILSHLEELTIEMHDDALVKNVKRLTGSSQMQSIIQLFRYSVYLSSNNLLSGWKTQKLVEWMNRSRTAGILDLLLDLKTPTTEIFGSNILVVAARLGYIDLVRNLLTKGVDANARAGEALQATALQEAVRRDHFRIVQLLLDAGADPSSHIGSCFSVLHDALDMSNSIETVQMLIKKGANVNGTFNPISYDGSVLFHAATKGDNDMIRVLLKAGASIHDMRSLPTALQAAVGQGNADVVQTLIDAGADIDAPAGKQFAEARRAAEATGEFSEPLLTPIQRASWADNIEVAQMLVCEGADVNACPWEADTNHICDEDDPELCDCTDVKTALQAAVTNQNEVLVRILLMADADVDARRRGDTPLQIAAHGKDPRFVRILLRHGADVNASAYARYGKTALQAAASRGNRELTQQLLDAGADINALASPVGGQTALQGAVESQDIELTKMLMEAGANLNADASPNGGRTCLQAAAEAGNAELVLLLLRKGADVNKPAAIQSGGLTALQAALQVLGPSSPLDEQYEVRQNGSEAAIFQALIDAGADVNAPPSPRKGKSALVAAVQTRSYNITRSLLQRGSDPDGYINEKSALGEAVTQGSIELVSLLIEEGANVNAFYGSDKGSWGGMTALQQAALKGNMPIARILLDAGAETSTPFDRPCSPTALQCAVQSNCTTLVQVLLAKGADPNERAAQSRNSSMALEEALSRWSINIEIVSALVDAGADVNKTAHSNKPGLLRLAAIRGHVEAVQLLLKAGACINATSEDKTTVLRAAISTNNVDLIKILLDAGADVNASAGPELGRTALQKAAEDSNTGILKLLLSHGADVNAPAGHSRGITALQGAAISGHLNIVLILLRSGAQINAPPASREGRMALDAAAEHGRLDIVHLLLKNDDEPGAIETRCKRAAKLAASNGHYVIARILREHKRRGSSAV
jgi:ankyrin repeat protein